MTTFKERKYRIILVLFFPFIFTLISFGQTKKTTKELLLENDSLYRIATNSNNDSLKNVSLQQYIKHYYKKGDWEAFNKVRLEHLRLTHKIKDTLSRAKTLDYVGAYFRKKYEIDSTYYYFTKSFQAYDQLKDSLKAGLILLNLAIIQKNYRDYSGSEYKCRKALKYLKNRAKPRRIASAYNNLGVLYDNLDDFDKSLKYHLKALKLRKQNNQNSIYIIHSLNNIGDIYITQEKYNEAIQYFNQALHFDSLINKYPKVKAALLDNRTYARFKNGEDKNILDSFNKALNIRKQIDDKYGMVNNYIHISEYYSENRDKQNAIINAEKASKIAKQIQHYQNYLESLEILGNLYSEEKSKTIFNEYKAIRDSLELADKKQRNSFYSIELLVDEKDNLLKENQKQVIVKNQKINILVVLSAFLLFSIIYFFIKKRKKNKQSSLLLESIEEELDKKTLQLYSLKDYGHIENDSKYSKAFKETLITKYYLSSENIEFWNVFIKGFSQKEQMEILGIEIDALNRRRTSLRNKIKKKRPINSNFTPEMAKRIYIDEEKLFKNTYL